MIITGELFDFIGCRLVSWSQGYLGIVFALSSLLISAGLYTLSSSVRSMSVFVSVPLAFSVSISLYFVPLLVLNLFGVTPQYCSAMDLTSAAMNQNVRACYQQLNGYHSLGAVCECNGSSPSPVCLNNAASCEANLADYQNAHDHCYCSTSSGSAVPVCTQLNQNATFSQIETRGNSFSIASTNGNICISGGNEFVGTAANSCITYRHGNFHGYINVTGTVQAGYACGGGSGFQGTGSAIYPVSSPASGCGSGHNASIGSAQYPPSSQAATGNPITFTNGVFAGGPITDHYLSIAGQPMSFQLTPNGSCVTESINGLSQGEFCE